MIKSVSYFLLFIYYCVVVLCASIVTFEEGFASGKSKTEELKQFVYQGLEFYKKNKWRALAEFSNPKGKFKKGDKYIFVLSRTGDMLAHINRKLIGKNLYHLKDVNGTLIIKEMLELARKPAGEGFLKYLWERPSTKKLRNKLTFIKRADDGNVLCCGIYVD